VPATEVRAAFEEVIRRAADEADFSTAVRAATSYASVAEAGQDRVRRAETNAAWADALEKTHPAEAKAKHAAAGAEFAAAAETAAAARPELLRQALRRLKQGGSTAEALAVADKLLAIKDLPPEDAGQAWLTKADLLPADNPEGIIGALNKAMEFPGPAATAARLKLAMQQITDGKRAVEGSGLIQSGDLSMAERAKGEKQIQLGRQLLVQLADASTVAPAEAAVHEEAVFQLGSLLMGDRQYADAEARFRKQIQLYPDGRMAGNGRLWLACCLVEQAGRTDRKEVDPGDRRLAESLDLLRPLLDSPIAFLRTQAEIRTLNTLLVQQKYDAVQKYGDELAGKYRGKPDELVVGRLMFHAILRKSPFEPGEALRMLLRMEEAYKGLAAADFPPDPAYSHDHWAKELPEMRKEMEKRKQ
jgi:hypothetical protein